MTYLITQTFILLLMAALLGLILGWYLTRISAASARASLQASLEKELARVRELRAERDAAVTARDSVESERRLLSDELNKLRAVHDGDDAEVSALKAELQQCRTELADAADSADAAVSQADHDLLKAELLECRTTLEAMNAPATGNDQSVDSGAIATAAAAALTGAQGLMVESLAVAETVDGEPDNLQQIKGIGPKIAGILNDLGIERFEQIAAWTPENIEWINGHLKFKGRVEREEWIPQARALIAARD